MRTGDTVLHRPSGEEWLVAWADYSTGYMAPCGWPTCQAKIADMDPIDPRRLRPRVYDHGQFEGEHRLRAIMAEQARAMNLFVMAIIIAACIGLVVYAACVGLSRAEAAYRIERRV